MKHNMNHNMKHNMNHNMKPNISILYRLALLGGALLSLSTLNAQGQTVIRRTAASRQITFANGQTLTLYSAYAATPNYAYQNYALTRAVSAASTYNPNYNPNYSSNFNPNFVPTAGVVGGGGTAPAASSSQTSSSGIVTAQYAGSSQLLVQWTGNTTTVRQVKLAVFDADLNLIDSQILTQTPVVARFAMTADIAYYGAQILYTNGKVTATYQPLQ